MEWDEHEKTHKTKHTVHTDFPHRNQIANKILSVFCTFHCEFTKPEKAPDKSSTDHESSSIVSDCGVNF